MEVTKSSFFTSLTLTNKNMEDLITALQILLKYGNPKNPTHCFDGYMFVTIDPNLVSDEDIKELKDLGFVEDHDSYDDAGFGSYKYGRT